MRERETEREDGRKEGAEDKEGRGGQVDLRKALDQGEFMFDLSTLLLAMLLSFLKLGFSGIFFEGYLYGMLAAARMKVVDCRAVRVDHVTPGTLSRRSEAGNCDRRR